jgi:hypothetical protein
MDPARSPSTLTVVAVIAAIVLVGAAVRLLLVHLPLGNEVPPMCEVESDFWNGDQILC